MRRLTKLPTPPVLGENANSWLAEFLADRESPTKKYRYRHPEIKQTLRQETGWKCVYCESKVGHNTPGDIEHKIPTSKDELRHFEWTNLTVACTECNRRKSDFYTKDDGFLDPYVDDVENCLYHLGPLVYWIPGHVRAELAIRVLELDSGKRPALINHKQEVLEKARALLDRVSDAGSDLMRALRQDELMRMCALDAEYSAMVQTYVEGVTAKGT